MVSIKWDKYLNVKETMSKNQGKEQNKIKIQGFVDWYGIIKLCIVYDVLSML